MNTVKCVIEGCQGSFQTTEPVSGNVRFICKNHERSVQVGAVRPYNETKDEADKEIHIQDHQFDKDVRRSAKPQGTTHIAHQGSEVLTADRIRETASWEVSE